ncbi:MAG: isoleucine--tRNA ligase [Acidobacteriota bacterium]
MLKQVDLKKTVNLPQTSFSMKANLSSMEPRMLEHWGKIDLYQKIRTARAGRPSFVLHDGPPYANGHIHLGHTLNKILKDLIVKSKTMEGFDSPYVPGWDCHGLPIEIKVLGRKKHNLDLLKVRHECREYARKYVNIQKEEFRRLGIFGQWDDPYLTMSHEYEAETARLFGTFVEKGSVYKGLKPVHWCISCETALAEAEVEYAEHPSPSVYVKFPVTEGASALSPELVDKPVSILIWTTTPWTLPANMAIAFHPDFEYSVVQVGEDFFILARELVEQVAAEAGFRDYRVVLTVKGDALTTLKARHPWIDRESKIVLGEHVTLEQGTGAVHTAPGHGHEDYMIGVEHGLEIYTPVTGPGRFTPEVQHFAGLQVFEANRHINDFMAGKGVLLAERQIEHSYPHCWRCHNPVIFRATPQWFISMDKAGLRQQALDEIGKVEWIPSWGEERISNMLANRPDWCISRQRIWGVPIVAFYCKNCNDPLLSSQVISHVAEIFSRESADAWYARSVQDLLPEGSQCPSCGASEFVRESDILDVWFDSGSSHHVVLGRQADLPWPADVYLEGGDQYRGWFHSSLLIAVGTRGAAPYKVVVCNGWTLDSEGRAMSKSLGNVISPLEIMKVDGAEILRLWVASIDYTEDVRLGEEILKRLREAYRKLRNTSRFMLGNLYDFSADRSSTEFAALDRWALARTAAVSRRVEEAYKRFEFHVVYHTLYNYCVVDLSNFYFAVLKDRLYTSAPESSSRRAAQTALFIIADTLTRLLAPILPFTAEEIWQSLYPNEVPLDSIHEAEFSAEVRQYEDPQLLQNWQQFMQIREKVSKALEESRQKKEIRDSLEAMISLRCGEKAFDYLQSFSDELRFLFIVSEVESGASSELQPEEVEVMVLKAPGEKCERCWNYRLSVGAHSDVPTVCSRCYAVLQEMT